MDPEHLKTSTETVDNPADEGIDNVYCFVGVLLHMRAALALAERGLGGVARIHRSVRRAYARGVVVGRGLVHGAAARMPRPRRLRAPVRPRMGPRPMSRSSRAPISATRRPAPRRSSPPASRTAWRGPVKRGKWILEEIVGDPPPPPPPAVAQLPEQDKGSSAGLSLRQMMERHRSDPVCASCHTRMDPIGFGFENYDALGRWRSDDGGNYIDRSWPSFLFRLANGEPLSSVIDQLKGARVEMDFGPQKIAGAIVSARLIAGDKDHAEREQLTLLMDSGDLRNVDLAAATSIQFTDVNLQLQFKDYLAALTSSRSKDKRSVYIDSTDAKSHEVQASYIIPMPAWKSSYRLMLDDTGTQPTLEGWAIVDNTTGEDWTNVKISLVSGKPISFISQLYAPKYIHRQGAELAEDAALARRRGLRRSRRNDATPRGCPSDRNRQCQA